MKKFIKNIFYYIQYLISIGLTKIFMCLPERVRFAFGEKVGSFIFRYVKEIRLITAVNLKLAFPHMSNEEIKVIGEKSVKVITKTFFLNMWLDKYLMEEKNFIMRTPEILEEAIEKGPSAMAAMHFGNMEGPMKLTTRLEAVTVAKDRTNPYLNDLLIKNRKRFNVTLLQVGERTGRDLIKATKEGKFPIILTDHRDSRGVDITFFGRETTGPVGIASIVMKYNLPFYLIYSILNDDNITETYMEEISVSRDENLTSKENMRRTVQNMFDKMEEIIKKYPEQWMWSYDRWRLYRDYKKDVLDNEDLIEFIKNFK